MPRAFMDKTGFALAATGKDARTATGVDMLMSSAFSNFALYMSGVATLVNITQQPPGTASPTNVYKQGIVTFGKTFAVPPMAFCGGIKPNGYVACAPMGTYQSSGGGNVFTPNIYWITSTTQLEIYVKRDFSVSPGGSNFNWHGPDASSASYYILENSIQ